MGWLDIALKAGTLLLSVGAMIVAIIRTRRVDTDRRFGKSEEKLTDLDRRVQRVEDGFGGLPTRDEMHNIALQLASVHGQLEVLSTRMRGHNDLLTRLERTTLRHEDHLMDKTKG